MQTCIQDWPAFVYEWIYFVTAEFILSFTLPLLVATTFYSMIGYRVWFRPLLGAGSSVTAIQRSKVGWLFCVPSRVAVLATVVMSRFRYPAYTGASALGKLALHKWPLTLLMWRYINELQVNSIDIYKVKALKMIIAVLLLFAVCWFPLHIFIVCLYLLPMDKSNEALVASAFYIKWLALSNSAVNPIVYYFFSNKYRSGWLISIVDCCFNQFQSSFQSFFVRRIDWFFADVVNKLIIYWW